MDKNELKQFRRAFKSLLSWKNSGTAIWQYIPKFMISIIELLLIAFAFFIFLVGIGISIIVFVLLFPFQLIWWLLNKKNFGDTPPYKLTNSIIGDSSVFLTDHFNGMENKLEKIKREKTKLKKENFKIKIEGNKDESRNKQKYNISS